MEEIRRHLFVKSRVDRLGGKVFLIWHKCKFCGKETSSREEFLKAMFYPELECKNGIELGWLKSIAVTFGATVNCLE
jgi:hypothetical protein